MNISTNLNIHIDETVKEIPKKYLKPAKRQNKVLEYRFYDYLLMKIINAKKVSYRMRLVNYIYDVENSILILVPIRVSSHSVFISIIEKSDLDIQIRKKSFNAI